MLNKAIIKNIEEGIADIKAGRVYTSKQVKKKLKLNQYDIETLKSIHEAWQEIENDKGGKAKTSKFFEEFTEW